MMTLKQLKIEIGVMNILISTAERMGDRKGGFEAIKRRMELMDTYYDLTGEEYEW